MKYSLSSLYIHFPFCQNKCNYCDFYKVIPDDKDNFSLFEERLQKEFIIHQNFINNHNYEWKPLETIYIGGGTPSFWMDRGAKFISKFLINNKLSLSNDYEFTIEVNPENWSDSSLKGWKKSGCNRFSTGIQSLNDKFLKLMDRAHKTKIVYKTLEQFNKLEIQYSVDFMLGLPFSSKYNRDIIKELEQILEYNPNHISIYILTVKPNYIYHNDLPSEDYIQKEYLDVSNYLVSKGFCHYEVSNFAKEGYKCKHNLNYWKSMSVAALGRSAVGYLSEKAIRYRWDTSKESFATEFLTDKQKQIESIYLSLRLDKGVDISKYLDQEKSDKFFNICQKWVDRKFISKKGSKISLNSKGFLLMDSFMGDILSVL